MNLHVKEFETKVGRFYNELWYFHIDVPEEISTYYKEYGITRLVCTINHNTKIYCALMPAGNGRYFINLNKEIRTKLNLEEGSAIHCITEEDKSEYGMPMAEELREAMDIMPEGDVFFHQLTPGKQRSLIYLVSKPKSVDKRIEKAIKILDHLIANNGLLDFKMLNEAFKAK